MRAGRRSEQERRIGPKERGPSLYGKGLSSALSVVLRDALWNQRLPLERVLKASRAAKSRPEKDQALPVKQNRRFTRAEVLAVISDYQSGIGTYELARKYACHRTTVANLLERNGVQRRSHTVALARFARAAALYAEGQSLAQIAAAMSVSPTTVLKHLRSQGVSIRGTHG